MAIINGENGLLTPVGNANALAAAMGKLLSDSQLRERMGKVGRSMAERRFSLAVAGKVFLDKYDDLCHQGLGRVGHVVLGAEECDLVS